MAQEAEEKYISFQEVVYIYIVEKVNISPSEGVLQTDLCIYTVTIITTHSSDKTSAAHTFSKICDNLDRERCGGQ